LRQDPDLRNTPLLVYTAKDLDEDDKERLQLGLTAHLTKSKISEEEFLKNVVNLLDGLIKPSTR
jgi:CheY-like chemotaxis protein